MCLSAWSSGGGTVWEGSEGVALLGECVKVMDLETSEASHIPSVLFVPVCGPACELSAAPAAVPLLRHHGL